MITDKGNVRNKLKGQLLEVVGLRFYDMMSWLVIHGLMNNNINLFKTLSNVGNRHRNIGAKKEDFKIYLKAFHETLEEYFPETYEIDVKFSFEQVFCIATQIMCNESENLQKINDIDTKKHNSQNIGYNDPFGIDTKLNAIKTGEFLKSYEKCLLSKIGREYLFRYLGQTLCYEYAIFLRLAHKYYNEDNDKGKFMIARIIKNKCLTNGATFEINVSYECYKNVMYYSSMIDIIRWISTQKYIV